MNDLKRCFVAVEVSEEARREAGEYINRLRSLFPNVKCRWVAPENLHITCWFIGEVDDEKLKGWKSSVDRAAAALSRFSVTIEGTGSFAQHRQRSRVLWLGVTATPPNSFIEIAMYLQEDKRVKPHLTIARLKESSDAHQLISAHTAAEFGPMRFTANELVIYHSELTPSGSVYTPVHRANLKG